MDEPVIRTAGASDGEVDVRTGHCGPVVDLQAARRARSPLTRPAAGVPAAPSPQVPEWAMLRPPAATDRARAFGNWMVPLRAVLIGLLWATSSPARAGVTAAALILLYALI